MTARLVTPRLVVGVPHPDDRVRATLVTDAITAATLVRSGERVAVLTDAVAAAVLVHLGVDPVAARQRVGFHDGLNDDDRLGEDPELDFDEYMRLLNYLRAILGSSPQEATEAWLKDRGSTRWDELLHFGDRYAEHVDHRWVGHGTNTGVITEESGRSDDAPKGVEHLPSEPGDQSEHPMTTAWTPLDPLEPGTEEEPCYPGDSLIDVAHYRITADAQGEEHDPEWDEWEAEAWDEIDAMRNENGSSTVSPRLTIGINPNIPSTSVFDATTAAELMRQGTRVNVPNPRTAVETLELLGADRYTAINRVLHSCGL